MNKKAFAAQATTFVVFSILGAILFTGVLDAAEYEIWTDEDVTGYITPTNASKSLCIGTTCNTAYMVSIETNASIDNSPICTVANGLCGTTTPSNETVTETAECDGSCTTVTEAVYT